MMARPFEFTAWTKFQDQPLAFPGKIYDRADNEGVSACPVGGPAPYGRVLVRGPETHPATRGPTGVPAFGQGDRYYTLVDSCCLPDEGGTHLKTPEGVTFLAEGISLPLDDAGLLIPLGIGMWTEHNAVGNTRLAQPFGLGDYFYQPENSGQVGIATDGRIWAYCETDVNVGDDLYFRTAAGSTTDGVQLLGAFGQGVSWAGSPSTQRAAWAKVARPGKAGGAFVASIKL